MSRFIGQEKILVQDIDRDFFGWLLTQANQFKCQHVDIELVIVSGIIESTNLTHMSGEYKSEIAFPLHEKDFQTFIEQMKTMDFGRARMRFDFKNNTYEMDISITLKPSRAIDSEGDSYIFSK